MKNFLKKFICKNIIEILTIYRDSIDHDRLEFKNYLDQTIYFEAEELIRYIKERRKENGF